MDRDVDELLSRIGEQCDATRVLLHWHRAGVVIVAAQWHPSHIAPLTGHPGVPADVLAQWSAALDEQQMVFMQDASQLDAEWWGERVTMQTIGVMASASIAIRGTDGVAGSIVVHSAEPRQWDEAAVGAVLQDAADQLAPLADAAVRRVSAVATSSFTSLPVALVVLDGAGGVLAANGAAREIGVRIGEEPRPGLDAVTDLNPEATARIESAIQPLVLRRATSSRTELDVWGTRYEAHFMCVGDGPDREILGTIVPMPRVDHVSVDVPTLIRDGGLAPAYQPIVDPDGHVVGAEALCRIVDPRLTSLTPTMLIESAERTGSIALLDRWMLRGAVADHPRIATAPGFRISVNLAVDTLLTGITDDALTIVRNAGLELSSIQFEITETTELHDPRAVAELIRLRDAGFVLALDDFGSGYSSFTYVTELPIEVVKLDRSLIRAGARDERAALVARRVSELANELGLRHMAEGVETVRELEFVRSLGCVSWQGFLRSPALRPADFVEMALRPVPSDINAVTGA